MTKKQETSNPPPKNPKKELLQEWSFDLLKQGVPLTFRAEGQSMMPLIKPGDTLKIIFVSPPFHRGDILAVNRKGTIVFHRLISNKASTQGKYIVTRGDNVAKPDGPAQEKDVIGKIIAVNTGRWFINIQDPRWFIPVHLVRLYSNFCATTSWIVASVFKINPHFSNRLRSYIFRRLYWPMKYVVSHFLHD